MAVTKASDVSKKGINNGCYVLGKLVEAWGLTPIQISGGCGCWYCESTIDPAVYNKEEKAGTFKGSKANGPGYGAGLAQWSMSRKAAVQRLCNRHTPIETWSLDQQIEAIIKEVKPNFLSQLRNVNTISASTDIWLRGYENGGGGAGPLASVKAMDAYTWAHGYRGLMQGRCIAAQVICEAYMGGNLGQDVIGDIPSIPASGYSSQSYSYSATYGGGNGTLTINAKNNIYGGVDTSTSAKHTRIYQAFGPNQKLDTLEQNIDGSNNPIDTSTNAATTNIDTSTNVNAFTNVDTSTNTNENTVKIEDVQGRTSSIGGESLLAAGVAYPVIRINDYYINYEFINSMIISTTGFVPKIELIFTTKDKELMKGNAIKEGDIIAVFIASTQAAFKSLRCDFLITSFITPTMSQSYQDATYTYRIYGELYISNLYNANLTFSFAGTSRDALMFSAEQLKLGFFFNDPDNTDDDQMWYCMAEMGKDEMSEEERPSNIKEFIQQTTAHAWKNFESFFDSWIDLRYGLTFLNINKQLGEHGQDEEIDFTPWESAISNAREIDGHKASLTPTEDKNKQNAGETKPALKLISNIKGDDTATTTFYCTQYEVINQAGKISREMGANIQKSYVINNQGVDNDTNQFTMNYSIPYNEWKLQNGFYMLIGPGKNESYIPGDSFSEFVKTNNVKQGGQITNIQADTDGAIISETGDNMLATGNVNKFYEAGYEHNRINNLQLQKKYVKFTLNGANFGIMRGEKIPAMIVNMSAINQIMQSPQNPSEIKLSNYLEEDMSGWFIIDGIRYIYEPNTAESGSPWKTEVKCIRREWPISGESVCKIEETEKKDEVAIVVDPSNGTEITSQQEEPATEQPEAESVSEEPEDDGNVTTAGLKSPLKMLWSQINKKAKLIQGRWYAVDENGKKVQGHPYITNGNLYKVMNEKGEIIYVHTTNWEHYYGLAMNISYEGGMEQFMKDIIDNNIMGADISTGRGLGWGVLLTLYLWGISAYEETYKSGTIESKTIHITLVPTKQKEFWQTLELIAENTYENQSEESKEFWKYYDECFTSYLTKNDIQYSKVPDKTRQDIDESTLNQNKE